jgi:Mrp family chromosome partitioning ATPase
MESQAMERLLQEARRDYDLVVVDTPPLTAVSDAFPLLRRVDGVIMVGRVGLDRRDVAKRTHETLVGVGAPLLGIVANGVKPSNREYYGYGYYAYVPSQVPMVEGSTDSAGDEGREAHSTSGPPAGI